MTITVNIEIKICGLTGLTDARAALEAGADFLGFVLYSRSPRAVTPGTLARIAGRLDGRARLVGVFVNKPAEQVAEIARDCGLYAVQLHGDEVRSEYAGLTMPVWRAFRLIDGVPRPAPDLWPARRFVMDAAAGKGSGYGGSGRQADWETAAVMARRIPLMLAGGLNTENVAEAVRRVRPLGVDVAGGVEKAPGKKDYRKMSEFVRAARAAAG